MIRPISLCDRGDCSGLLRWNGECVETIGGCGEPCAWQMRKAGHGKPPFPECMETRGLLRSTLEAVIDGDLIVTRAEDWDEIQDVIDFANAMETER